jgi:hypothetical protein
VSSAASKGGARRWPGPRRSRLLAAFLRPDPLEVARAAAPSTGPAAPAGGRGGLAALLGDRAVRLALLVLALAAAAPSLGPAGTAGALVLLGVGWNAGLIGGSALLRDAPLAPSLRPHAEGLGELGMGGLAGARPPVPWPPRQ